jgi:aminocarboxymuconate-semialdehyde decarboxylase
MTIDGNVFREVRENLWHPGVRIEECDRHGVDLQVLSTVPVMFCYWAQPEHALDLSRILNDHIAGVVRDEPRRFVGLGTIPLQAPDLAVRELERCVRELGLAGVEIGTNVMGRNLDDPSLRPVFEAAQELGAAVFVHPWDVLAKERLEKYWLKWLVGMPAETSLAICSVIFGGVLERFPRLRIAFAHGGGSFPGTFGRIQRGFDVRPDLVAVDNPVAPRDHLGRFYVDSLVHDAAALRHLVSLLGAERVALGSDYPFPLGESVPGSLIEATADLPEAVRRRLLSDTALEFLGIPAARFDR